MKQNTKDWIHYTAAMVLLTSGVLMGFLSFLLTKEIGGGPLTYIGEAFSTSLVLFGLGYYVVSKVGELKSEIRRELGACRKEGCGEEDGGSMEGESHG